MVLSLRQQRRLIRPSLSSSHYTSSTRLTHSLTHTHSTASARPLTAHPLHGIMTVAAHWRLISAPHYVAVVGEHASLSSMAGEQLDRSTTMPFDVPPCLRSRPSVGNMFTGRADLSPADSVIVRLSSRFVMPRLFVASRSNPLAELALARSSLPSLDIFDLCADSQHLTVAHNRRSSEFFCKFFCHT